MKTYNVKLIDGNVVKLKAKGYEVFHNYLICFYTVPDGVSSKVYEWHFSLFGIVYIKQEMEGSEEVRNE